MVSIANLLMCFSLTIYGYYSPESILEGTKWNTLGEYLTLWALFPMMISLFIFTKISIQKGLVFSDIKIIERVLLIIFGIHALYRVFFSKECSAEIEGNFTSTKLMIFMALSLYVNMVGEVISRNVKPFR